MTEVTIKSYTRRGKGGKTIQVKGYTRRVGRKGVRSPKRERSSGEEIEQIVATKKEAPRKPLTPEEIALRREVTAGMRRAEAEKAALGMTTEQYSRYVMSGKKSQKSQASLKATSTSPRKPIVTTPKKKRDIFESVEDKLANFVEKYSGKKYKRQF